MTSSVTSVRVLLVDLNHAETGRLSSAFALHKLNSPELNIFPVLSLREALRQLGSSRFDVVLVNIDDVSVDEVLGQIRDKAPALPIIVITDRTDAQAAIVAIQNGADDVLVIEDQTRESIERAIRRSIERNRFAQSLTHLRLIEEREHFMDILAHKLSTPIVGAQRILSVLNESSSIDDDVRNLLVQISASNQTLLRAIDNVLHLYRYKNGYDAFVKTFVNVSKLVSYSLNELATESAAKQISYVRAFNQADVIVADSLAMRKIAINLLSNAIKYAPCGSAVTIKFESLSNQSVLSISHPGYVSDPEIVDLSRDNNSGRNRRYQTISEFCIGLDLCKRLVEEQHGTIVYTSEINQGTTMRITMPHVAETKGNNQDLLNRPANNELAEKSLY